MSGHGLDTAIEHIRKHRQAFSHGIFSARSMIEYGIDKGVPMEPLSTNIEPDLIHVGEYLPRVKCNHQLYQATANRLAMQLVVSVGDTYKTNVESDWQNSEHSEIQFLWQVRNAAAHNNKLKFQYEDDPCDDTRWNDFTITSDIEGQQVYPDISEMITYSETVKSENGFFEAGDTLSLLSDVLELLVEWSDEYTLSDIRHPPENDSS